MLIRTYAYTYTHIRVYIYAHTRILIRTYAHTYTHIRVYLYAYYARFLVNVYLSSTVRCSRQRVAQCLFQLALWLINIFFDVDIVTENKWKCGLSWSVLLSTTSMRHNSFPKHFLYCFCMLSSDFAKVFERKVWREQADNLHNAARALSNRNCQKILTLSLILW